MSFLSNNNDKIIKIMDNNNNILVDVTQGHTSTIAHQTPFAFKSDGSNLTDYIIYGNTGGVGDLNSTTGKYEMPIVFLRKSKNLIELKNNSYKISKFSMIPSSNGGLVINSDNMATPNYVFTKEKLYPSGTYTFSCSTEGTITSGGLQFEIYINGNKQIENNKIQLPSASPFVTFTLTQPSLISFSILAFGGFTCTDYFVYPQLEKGNQATSFSPRSKTFILSLDSPINAGSFISLTTTNTNLTPFADNNLLSIDTSIQPGMIVTKGNVNNYLGNSHNIKFYDESGNNLLEEQLVLNGDDSYFHDLLTKDSTAQYNYSFSGWAASPNQSTAVSGILENIIQDKNVYAVFDAILRKYTVYFYNGIMLLQTSPNIPYGGTATYTGNTPIKQSTSTIDYVFTGWTPSNSNIIGDTSCYAQFYEVTQNITDTWDEIAGHVESGDYTTRYSIGDTKILDLGSEKVAMQIVAFDTDDLSDNSGKAPITWLSKELLKDTHRMNTRNIANGGWLASGMRSYLQQTIKPSLPVSVQGSIKTVRKYTKSIATADNSSISNAPLVDDLWIPSCQEMFGSFTSESNATPYSRFANNASRVKARIGQNSEAWWLRSTESASRFYVVNADGSYNSYGNPPTVTNGVALMFCTGALPKYTINYYSQDGQTLLNSEQVYFGHNGIYSTTPTKPSTSQYDYTFVGWSTDTNSTTATSGVTQNIQDDIDVYAAFRETEKIYYTVNFYNGDTLLQTVSVLDGGTASYTGATPTSTEQNYIFNGWEPSNSNISTNTDCYAQFVDNRLTETITDSWSEIIASCNDGTYASKYSIGDTKILDMGNEGQVEMQIVGINADDLSDNSGKAPITWVTKQLALTPQYINSYTYNNSINDWYRANWTTCTLRSYLRQNIIPLMPAAVQNGIKEVKKYTNVRTAPAWDTYATELSNETIWLLSYREVNGEDTVETQGVVYSDVFTDDASRIKTRVGDSLSNWWWLRSASIQADGEYYAHFCYASRNGTGRVTSSGSQCDSSPSYVVFGFCT